MQVGERNNCGHLRVTAEQVAQADSAECHAACKARGAGVAAPCGGAA